MTSPDPDQPLFIIGAPFEPGADYSAIPGTRTLFCEHCKGATVFAPSSLSHPEAGSATFICMSCASKLEGPSEIGEFTPLQMGEIRQAMARELENAFTMFTIFKSPSDYPGSYVVRRFRIVGLGIIPDPDPLAVCDSLGSARLAIQDLGRPGLVCVPAQPDDEPQIVESWM